MPYDARPWIITSNVQFSIYFLSGFKAKMYDDSVISMSNDLFGASR